MSVQTSISWADMTFNPWIGCTKVSPACEHCYAERDNKRFKWTTGWGAGVPRRRTSRGYWAKYAREHRKAVEQNQRPRIFCAPSSDVFDNEVDDSWRRDLWQFIRDTPSFRWMLLTKRIGNARKMLPKDWPFANAGLMSTIANQEEWDRDYRKLIKVPAAWHGVSVEPMLGPVIIGDARPDWIICGGESGPRHRNIEASWVRSLRDQCAKAGIAFHFKQWGGIRPKSNGCMLDGREHKAADSDEAARV